MRGAGSWSGSERALERSHCVFKGAVINVRSHDIYTGNTIQGTVLKIQSYGKQKRAYYLYLTGFPASLGWPGPQILKYGM